MPVQCDIFKGSAFRVSFIFDAALIFNRVDALRQQAFELQALGSCICQRNDRIIAQRG